jgi:hypothetical protein
MSGKPTCLAVTDPAFRAVLDRHKAFWAQEGEGGFLRSVGVFAPSAPVSLRQPDGRLITQAERLEPDMIDPASLVREVEEWDRSALGSGQLVAFPGLGDVMPFCQPLFKIPWLEAMLGCPIVMTDGQIWVGRFEGDLEAVIRHGANFEHNPWYQLYLEFIRVLQERLGDRYPVSANTLLRGTSDLAAALMGVREACIAWIEEPAWMARLLRVCADANLSVIEAGFRALKPFEGGYVSGFGVWAPSPVVRTQADHSTLLSPGMYERQILPYDLEVIRACPMCIFHIHNNGYHIAPTLVEVVELDAIEVVVDPYPARSERRAYEIEMMQMIQEYKPLILDANYPDFEESERVLDQLDRRGLCYNARFDPQTFASLPSDVPGGQKWLLQPEVDRAR